MTTPDNAGNQNLSALRMAELRQLAQAKGIRGISAMRKGQLIAAIQGGAAPAQKAVKEDKQPVAKSESPAKAGGNAEAQPAAAPEEQRKAEHDRHADKPARDARESREAQETGGAGEESHRPRRNDRDQDSRDDDDRDGRDAQGDGEPVHYESRSAARRARRNRARQNQRERERNEGGKQGDKDGDGGNDRRDRNNRDRNHDDDRRGRRGRRDRRRGRDRDNRDRRDRENNDEPIREEELQTVAGILDVVDNNVAFLRTSGYHAAPTDVFVPQQLIRRNGLRRGDAVVGQVKLGGGQTHGRGRNKHNNLLRVGTVNGVAVDDAKQRPDFAKLTPLYPNQRLRLETEQKVLTTRVIDLIMPIGKGQRALIVSPPKAGKTTILQNIANAIATNNPECYLMVVLVDERPEEVTDMQRFVEGEVIASTFDRPPSDHTAVAELAIERAKRIVEQGKDVVVLLDSITRLGRAYNNSSPASGRILSGGVDSNALYPPKRFLGAARNIENGGSLTIIATAMVETGSAGDTVIFEEFKGTGNAELKLDRKISERRVFPAVDVNPSGTRKDELLLAPEEARIMHKLRRILSALDNQQAIDLLIKQLKKTKSNREFLVQVASSAPMVASSEDEEDFS